MTDTSNRPLLWREMCRAMAEVEMGARATKMYAAEIRALRDWLVPQEIEPTGMRPCGDTYSAQSIKRGERQRLRALLTAEADRAERGEVEQ